MITKRHLTEEKGTGKRGHASLIKPKTCLSPFTCPFTWGQYIDELLFFGVPGESAPTTYRVLSDLLYRSVAIVTTSNVITEAYDCDAYGNTLLYSGPGTDEDWFTDDDVRTNSPINTTIFTGRLYDPETQIYYYRARYFSPQIGRFLSRDPLGSPTMMEVVPSIFDKLDFVRALSYVALQTMGAKLNTSSLLIWLCNNSLPSIDLGQEPNLYQYVGNNPVIFSDPFGLCPCGEHLELDWNVLTEDEEFWTGGGIADLLGSTNFIVANSSSLPGTMGKVFSSGWVGVAEDADPLFTLYGALVHARSFDDAFHCVADPDPTIGADFSGTDGEGVEASSGLP